MTHNIELYIAGKRVDILDYDRLAEQLSFNYQFSDVTDLAAIKSGYSSSVDIPGTANNNNIFGHIWKFDSEHSLIFNPSTVSEFNIYADNSLFQTGNAKLMSVKMSGKNIIYTVELYVQITNIFNVLTNNDKNNPDNKLLSKLRYPTDLIHTLSLTNMNTFINGGTVTERGTRLTDYMNYMLSIDGLYDNFDSSKRLSDDGPWKSSSEKGKNLIESTAWPTCRPVFYSYSPSGSNSPYTNANVKEASSEDLEFDSYTLNQYNICHIRPVVKMDKLIEQIVKDLNEDGQTYKIKLDDPNFFSENNPYWNSLYMVLPQYNSDMVQNSCEGKLDSSVTKLVSQNSDSATFNTFKYTVEGDTLNIVDNTGAVTKIDLSKSPSTQIELEFLLRFIVLSDEKLPENVYWGDDYHDQTKSISDIAAISLSCRIVSDSGNTLYLSPDKSNYYPSWFNSTIAYTKTVKGQDVDLLFKYSNTRIISQRPVHEYTAEFRDLPLTLSGYAPASDYNFNWRPLRFVADAAALGYSGTITLQMDGVSHRFRKAVFENDKWNYYGDYSQLDMSITAAPIESNPDIATAMKSYGYTGNSINLSYYNSVSPNSQVSVRNIFNINTTQGEILINYAKLFGLVFETDDINETVSIKTRNEYFKDYKIFDWSDKVDRSRDITVTPLTFNNAKYVLKYKNGGTYYETKYQNETGFEYGSQIINTGYKFNSNSVNIIDSIFVPTIMAKEPKYRYIPSFKHVGPTNVNNFVGYIEKSPWPMSRIPAMPTYFKKSSQDSPKTPADSNLSLIFKTVTKQENVNLVESTDDMLKTDASTNGGQYCWVDETSFSGREHAIQTIRTTSWNTLSGECSTDIGKPTISYVGETDKTYKDDYTIYSKFWKNYINEIYNVDNKIVTCYVNLSVTDIKNFSFKNFVIIDGGLYHPNKIENINPFNSEPVQVELIKVSDINAYISGQNIPGN